MPHTGRPSKYDWDDKKDICYQLYVEEKKTPNEIVKYFAEHFGVPESEIPSARLFRRQFTEKWGFPPRIQRLKNEDESVVLERIRQLWEQNLLVAKIRETLDDEGWELGDNDFQRLRKSNGFIRRGTFGAYGVAPKATKKRKRGQAEALDEGLAQAGVGPATSAGAAMSLQQQQQAAGISPEEAARRAQHLAQVQAESDQAFAARKRRNRIRGYGHLPPDEPGIGPRYTSETTLDECKAFLHLSNDMYATIRDDYETVCREMGIDRKKNNLENGLWQASKDRLIRENLHLSAMLHPPQTDLEKKAISIDVICVNVTKYIRDRPKKLTMAEANNELGLNPNGSKDIRRAFYNILEQDQYTTRLACGDEHYNELRQAWYASSPLLQQVMAEGDPHKLRCVDVLCRDARKRYNDDSLRKDPNRKQYQQKLYGPGPGSARIGSKKKDELAKKASPEKKGKIHAKNGLSSNNNFGLGSNDQPVDVDIDPALSNHYAPPEPLAIPVYFRLSPQSQIIGNHARLWLGKLTARTLPALHQAATSKAGAAQVTKVHGLIKDEDGSEDSYQIDGDDELDVYLGAAGERSTFVVVLEGGYA